MFRQNQLCLGIMEDELKETEAIVDMDVSEIGESLAALRLVHPRSNNLMKASIQKYGQLSPVVVGPKENGFYELVDGFKRLYACRELGHGSLRARQLFIGRRGLKVAMIHLNWAQSSIGDLEEAMVLKSLYRDDCLTQQEIATLMGRHNSWVSRRISLIERLCDEVIDHIRLGLVSASIGRELAKLPRGKQEPALALILKYRFNCRESERLVRLLVSSPKWDQEAILRFPGEILEDRNPPKPRKPQKGQPVTTIMETLMAMKTQTQVMVESLSPEVLDHLTQEQIRQILSLIKEVEDTLAAFKKLFLDKDHDSALC